MSRGKWRAILYGVLLVLVAGGVTWRVQQWQRAQHVRRAPQLTFAQEKVTTIPPGPSERYLILYHSQQDIPDVDLVRRSLEVSFQYSRLPFDEMTFDQWKQDNAATLPYQQGAIIVIGENQASLTHVERLTSYVETQGGLLINAVRSPTSPLNALMGIQGAPDFINYVVNGWHWKQKIYPGLSDHDQTGDWMTSSSLSVQLDPASRVFAESTSTPHVPYVWMLQRGRGHVLYWNTTALQEKDMRGVFLQTMMLAQGGGAKLAVGSQVWYIDDFPSPAYQVVSKGNKTGMTDANFRLKHFDPEMQEIANRYGIRYSTGAIFIYNDRVSSPFAFSNAPFQKLYNLESGLATQGGELGLHGYNHIPLRLRYTPDEEQDYGYPPFSSVTAMHAQLQMAKTSWAEQMHRPLPTFYIPPSNLLSQEGEQALVEEFPELQTISSVYNSTEERGAFAQEFLPDPEFPQIMGTPRVTSGYFLHDDQLFSLYSAVGAIGIVTHFNHPDDVFDPQRSQGKSWNELRTDFGQLVSQVNRNFSWLQPLTATELSAQLRRYYRAQTCIDRSQPGRIIVYVTPLEGPMFVEVRVNQPKSWAIKQGGEIVGRDEAYGLLWVKLTEPKLVLEGAK